MITCTIYGAELTGGLDTFGAPHKEMCYECFMAIGTPSEELKRMEHDLSELEMEARSAQNRIDDLEDELEGMKDNIRNLRTKIHDLKTEKQDPKTLLLHWVGAS